MRPRAARSRARSLATNTAALSAARRGHDAAIRVPVWLPMSTVYIWIAPTPSGGAVPPRRPAASAIYPKAHAKDDAWDIYASTGTERYQPRACERRPSQGGPPRLVGARGFEPPTPTTPLWCATRLRYAPTYAHDSILTPPTSSGERHRRSDGVRATCRP